MASEGARMTRKRSLVALGHADTHDDASPSYEVSGGSDGGTGATPAFARVSGTRAFEHHGGAAAAMAPPPVGPASAAAPPGPPAPPPPCAQCLERWRSTASEPAPRPVAGSRAGKYTVCDVALHRSPNDAWLTAHGVVYDCTSFIDVHPGGRQSILRHAGTDCSEDHDFHSVQAQRLWDEYQIGRLTRCLAGGDLNGLTRLYACAIV